MKYTLEADNKENASKIFVGVVERTKNNFPDARFHPTSKGINPHPYTIAISADGIGTKAELAERAYDLEGTPSYFETLGFDLIAMVKGDAERHGHFLLGVAEILDVNSAARLEVIEALAKGLENAANEARVAVLNGETAELGYRTAGAGEVHVNWNAVGVSLVVPEKELTGEKLAVGQPIVGFRELGLRSNGFTLAKRVLELSRIHEFRAKDKKQLFLDLTGLTKKKFESIHSEIAAFNRDILDQYLVDWDIPHFNILRQLLIPSALYGTTMFKAQGGIDGEPKVRMTAASHITGGGVPEKMRRTLAPRNLGAAIRNPFPEPEAITSLAGVLKTLPEEMQKELKLSNGKATYHWNRGLGFVVVTETVKEAEKLIKIAQKTGTEAKIVGEIIEPREIHYKNDVFAY